MEELKTVDLMNGDAVEEAEETSKSNKGLIIGAAIVATAGVAAIGYVIYKRHKKKKQVPLLMDEQNQILDADFEDTDE